MTWAAIIAALAGAGISASGGKWGNSSENIAAGLNKYTSRDQSYLAHAMALQNLYGNSAAGIMGEYIPETVTEDGTVIPAHRKGQEALSDYGFDAYAANIPGYKPQMDALIAEARKAGRGQADAINSGLGGMNEAAVQALLSAQQRGSATESMARSATEEAKKVYGDYGRGAEGNINEAYRRALAEIDAGQARGRVGRGYSSSDAMLAAGQRGEASYARNRSMTDLYSNMAQQVGGAVERGRSQEIAAKSNADAYIAAINQLKQQQSLDAMKYKAAAATSEFSAAAPYMEALYSNEFKALSSDPYMYPELNARRVGTGTQGPDYSGNLALGSALMSAGGELGGIALGRSDARSAGLTTGSTSNMTVNQPLYRFGANSRMA